MSVICCGFGHRFLFTNIELELDEVIEKLITENGVDVFYTGGMGQFDEQFTNTVRKAKLKHNHISLFFTLATVWRTLIIWFCKSTSSQVSEHFSPILNPV